MGSIKVNSKEKVGEVSYETEYTFTDASDFFAWEDIKVERLTNAVKGFNLGGEGLFTDPEGSDIFGNSEPAKPFIDVKKKAKETKH